MKIWMSVLAAVVVFGLAGVSQAAKAKGEGKGLKGQVVSVAADGTSVVITTGGKKNATELTIPVDKETTVTVDGAASKVSDLKKDMYVMVSPATGTAKTITATTTKPEKKPKA